MAMLHDVARCSGCRACMVACKQWHDLPADFSTPFNGQYQSHADLTPTTWNLIKMKEHTDSMGKFHWDFIKFQCMHCQNPACMLGCPEGAISQKESGAVVIDEDKCVGCGYCRTNCPFNVPRIDSERNKSTKCDLCFDRIDVQLRFGRFDFLAQVPADFVWYASEYAQARFLQWRQVSC